MGLHLGDQCLVQLQEIDVKNAPASASVTKKGDWVSGCSATIIKYAPKQRTVNAHNPILRPHPRCRAQGGIFSLLSL